MSEDLIRYDILAQDALRGVVKKVLTEVSGTGLPGEHHFYITFNTQAPGVRISPRLLGKYPKDMTIVLQHQFWDMQTSETAVEIGLSFDGIPEKLYIPYTSIISFIDPSVHFSLQFEVEEEYDEDEEDENLISEEEQDDIILSVIGDVDEEKSESPKSTKDDKDQAAANADNKDAENVEEKDGDKGESEAKPEGAEVVSLDAFRKK
ncbi:MAG TPA: hypothetical protein DCS30_11425 [Rhizobiales bacterium]|nr:hypothetical protein [Hyphomicrobiales bacterium]